MSDLLTRPLLLIGGLGWQELLLILLIVVAIFGGSKIAGIGKGLGEGVRNFKKGLKGDDGDGTTPEPGNKR